MELNGSLIDVFFNNPEPFYLPWNAQELPWDFNAYGERVEPNYGTLKFSHEALAHVFIHFFIKYSVSD